MTMTKYNNIATNNMQSYSHTVLFETVTVDSELNLLNFQFLLPLQHDNKSESTGAGTGLKDLLFLISNMLPRNKKRSTESGHLWSNSVASSPSFSVASKLAFSCAPGSDHAM